MKNTKKLNTARL